MGSLDSPMRASHPWEMEMGTTKQRVQFDFSPEALQRLEALKEHVDASTKAEVIRNALKMYEWLDMHADSNYVIERQDQDGKTVFRIPVKVLLS